MPERVAVSLFNVGTPCDTPEVVWLDLPMEMSFHEFSGGKHPLDDMDVILTASAGQGFIAKLAQRGVQVITCGESDPRKAVRDFLLGEVKPANPHAHLEQERHAQHLGAVVAVVSLIWIDCRERNSNQFSLLS